MNQPELGLKVAELRQQKGLTQEQLAEVCEVSTRTIQRIESGEVDPRAYTLTNLNNALQYDFGQNDLENESLWLAALHLSSTICFVVIPLLIWSWKKNKSLKIDQHGRDVLNFQITINLVVFADACVLMILPVIFTIMETSIAFAPILLFTTTPLFLIGLFTFYQGVKNTLRALSDQPTHYPLSIKFVK
ncbi:MAG: helix-turn-helix domain-containing protein [Chloroflexota bacterium]